MNTQNSKSEYSGITPCGVNSPDFSLPVFYEKLKKNMTFPLGWKQDTADFALWKKEARGKASELMVWDRCTLPFNASVLAEEDRGTYTCRRIAFTVSSECRIPALLLVPKQTPAAGRFPAAVFYHDHGGRFDIGKEKCIRPFKGSAMMPSAVEWTERLFDGRFIGDELAARGWVVLCCDALGWGERSCPGYRGDSQQALASNLFNLGTSYAALIAQDDVRTAEFLASLPYVDTNRIAAIGFSMGAFRAWQVSALTDCITACAANCWMAAVKGLMIEGNNQLKGQSAFTMCHPGLLRYLDYPDIAGLAAPRPLIILAGETDHLFPPAAVQEAFHHLHDIYAGAGATDRLETCMMPGEHEFGIDRQEKIFSFLSGQFCL